MYSPDPDLGRPGSPLDTRVADLPQIPVDTVVRLTGRVSEVDRRVDSWGQSFARVTVRAGSATAMCVVGPGLYEPLQVGRVVPGLAVQVTGEVVGCFTRVPPRVGVTYLEVPPRWDEKPPMQGPVDAGSTRSNRLTDLQDQFERPDLPASLPRSSHAGVSEDRRTAEPIDATSVDLERLVPKSLVRISGHITKVVRKETIYADRWAALTVRDSVGEVLCLAFPRPYAALGLHRHLEAVGCDVVGTLMDPASRQLRVDDMAIRALRD